MGFRGHEFVADCAREPGVAGSRWLRRAAAGRVLQAGEVPVIALPDLPAHASG
jgi:hypothetical protein